jgi:chromosome segregation ATPase
VTKAELTAELLDLIREQRDLLLKERDRLERKLAAARRRVDALTSQAEIVAHYKNELAQELEDERALRAGMETTIADLTEELETQRGQPKGEHWCEFREAATARGDTLGEAQKDRDLWAERCERAENLLRGYMQGKDPKDAAVKHFAALGENQSLLVVRSGR